MRACVPGWLGPAALAGLVFAAAMSLQASDLRLVDAAKRQDIAEVRALLQRQVDVDAAQPDGGTALHWAVYRDDLAMVTLLLAAHANPNASNDLGETPLMLAAESGNSAIVERLLVARANPDTPRPSGETPLMAASRLGHAQVVKLLLRSGADVQAKETWHSQTALMWAAVGGHAEVVAALVEARADVRARSTSRERVVSTGEHKVSASGQTGDWPTVMVGGFTPLLFAAQGGDAACIKSLLDAGAEVNDRGADGNSALVVAAHSGHVAASLLLLDRGGDPNVAGAGYTALLAAVLRGKPEIVRALLAHGAKPNPRLLKGMPLRRGGQEFALGSNWIGATPFLIAARFLEIDAMRALLSAGADPLMPREDGLTPLAAAVGRLRASRGVDAMGRPDKDFRRERTLSWAEILELPLPEQEEQAVLDATRIVIEAGADVNAVDAKGDTVLHGAALQGLDRVVEYLAGRGMKLDVRNKRGETALTLANQLRDSDGKPDPRTADLLRRLGAKDEGVFVPDCIPGVTRLRC